ncbi:MAG: hypothetical protein ABIH46_04200 [Chloroflexota bacterium]
MDTITFLGTGGREGDGGTEDTGLGWALAGFGRYAGPSRPRGRDALSRRPNGTGASQLAQRVLHAGRDENCRWRFYQVSFHFQHYLKAQLVKEKIGGAGIAAVLADGELDFAIDTVVRLAYMDCDVGLGDQFAADELDPRLQGTLHLSHVVVGELTDLLGYCDEAGLALLFHIALTSCL